MNYTKGRRHFILSCDIHIVDFDTPSHNLDEEVGLEMERGYICVLFDSPCCHKIR